MPTHQTHGAQGFLRAKPKAPVDECPRCYRFAMVRADSGLCEPCTAKMPEQRGAWLTTRLTAAFRDQRRSGPLPDNVCLLCCLPFKGTEYQHRRECTAKRFVCDACGSRWGSEHEMRWHQKERHGRV